jgi:aminopeptidase-like protein
MVLLWLLNMSDGENSLLDIAVRANLPWPMMKQAAQALSGAGLLKPIDGPAKA